MKRVRASLDVSLYLVLDPTMIRHRSVELILEEAVRGGITLVQVREKECGQEEFLSLAHKCASILSQFKIPLILNDRVDLVTEVGAQGVHLGQSDLPYQEARKILGAEAIIGLSVESIEQTIAVEQADIDYLGVSSIFPTSTKTNLKHIWGLEGLKHLRTLSSHRLVGIGGIDESNAIEVLQAGADGLAIVAAICKADSPKQASRTFLNLIEDKKQRILKR